MTPPPTTAAPFILGGALPSANCAAFLAASDAKKIETRFLQTLPVTRSTVPSASMRAAS